MPASQARATSSTAYAQPAQRRAPARSARRRRPSARARRRRSPRAGPTNSETSMPASAPMRRHLPQLRLASSIAPLPCETRLTTISCASAACDDLREHARRPRRSGSRRGTRRRRGSAPRSRRRRAGPAAEALERGAGLHAAASPSSMSRIAVRRGRPRAPAASSPVSVSQRELRGLDEVRVLGLAAAARRSGSTRRAWPASIALPVPAARRAASGRSRTRAGGSRSARPGSARAMRLAWPASA